MECYKRKGLSTEAAGVMISSITKGTLKQYEKPLRLWWNHCQEKKIPIYDAKAAEIIEFFTIQLGFVKSFSTINGYRAAISLISSTPVGSSPEICRFFKGVANKKPKNAKYSHTWDTYIVLDKLSSLFPNDGLSLQDLTEKLVTLLALVTAQRVQTLSKISLSNIIETENIIRIKITEKLKTSKHMKALPVLEIPFFLDNQRICPAKTLQAYIRVTSSLRPIDEEKLLIAYKKPYYAATTQSISRWIKNMLKKSGIDTSVFTAHSTRHASTSAAARNGADIETIRRAAGWSEKTSVFARFYNRPPY